MVLRAHGIDSTSSPPASAPAELASWEGAVYSTTDCVAAQCHFAFQNKFIIKKYFLKLFKNNKKNNLRKHFQYHRHCKSLDIYYE